MDALQAVDDQGEVFTPVATVDEAKDYIRRNGIEFVFAQFVDMHGKPCAKLVPVTHFDQLMTEGAGFAGFAAGDMGQMPNDPDLTAIPDVTTFTPVPFRPGLARMACDITVEGEEWPYCPRTILRRQLDRAKALGYDFKIGIELEYMLVRQKPDGTLEIADALDNLDKPCYDMRALTRNLDFVGRVARYIGQLGWGNYANDHEDAQGQYENNFDYDDALKICDRAVFFRYMVEAMAQEQGMLATFMPKPFVNLTGNGCHFHMSLWRDGENVFDGDRATDPRGIGLSKEGYHFLAGLKEHAKGYIAVTAPVVNSYKRLVIGGADSGSTWAPVFVSYGHNNRTQMLRTAPGRIEDRTIDGAVNPYLGATVVLAAGLDGIERELEPGEPTTDVNLHALTPEQRLAVGVELLPATLLGATRELVADPVLREALGNCGREDYVDYFARIKQSEFEEAHAQVTQWEIDRYLQRC